MKPNKSISSGDNTLPSAIVNDTSPPPNKIFTGNLHLVINNCDIFISNSSVNTSVKPLPRVNSIGC